MADKKNTYTIEIITGIMVFLGFTAISIFILPKICLDSLFSESTGLYFYSALVQSNAAIFSLLAIFVIFRMQYLDSRINSIRSELTNISQSSAGKARSFFEKDSQGRADYINSTLREADHSIATLYENANSHINELDSIKKIPLRPMIMLFLIIMFQAVLLLLASGIHSVGVIYEACVFVLVIMVQIFALTLILKNIKMMI